MFEHANSTAMRTMAAALLLSAAQQGHAETRSYAFTFDWDSGPLAGQVTNGQLSFDAALFHPTDAVQALQLFSHFRVEIDGRTFTETDAPGHYLRFHPNGDLRMMAVGNHCDRVSCYADDPQDWTIAWDGHAIGYAAYAHGPNVHSMADGIDMRLLSAVPEPGAGLLALMGALALGWLGKRNCKRNR